ncbi:MAG: type II secretion system protein [Candidatus Sumerlaeota bacterium]|nr:type II secretion system protein [Candidatus Sumerlaeota bacterium]
MRDSLSIRLQIRGVERGLTLVEVLVAMAVFTVVAVGALQSMQLYLLFDERAQEEAIVASYLEDYAENCMGLGFMGLYAGAQLPDGPSAGRAIPAYTDSSSWLSLTSTELAYFPDLAYLVCYNTSGVAQYPSLRVRIQTFDDSLNGAGDDYKMATIDFRWVPRARAIRGGSQALTHTLQIRCYKTEFYG